MKQSSWLIFRPNQKIELTKKKFEIDKILVISIEEQ